MSAPNQTSAFDLTPAPVKMKIKNISSAYTISQTDNGSLINCSSGTFTISFLPAKVLGEGFYVTIKSSSTGTITIDPFSSEKIDNSTTWKLSNGQSLSAICDGSNLKTSAIGIGSSVTWGTAFGFNSSGDPSVTGTYSAIAIGGSYSGNTDSAALCVQNNTSTYGAQGVGSFTFGKNSKVTGAGAVSLGETCTGTNTASITAGLFNTNNGYAGAALGFGIVLDGACSALFGYGTNDRGISSYLGFGSLVFGAQNLAQTGMMVPGGATTDATPKVLTSNGAAASAANQLVLQNYQAIVFDGLIIARQKGSDGTASASWQVSGHIRREGTAASTTLVTSTVTPISNVPGWTLALSADTTYGALAVTFTGAAATNIRSFADIRTAEVTYA